MPFAIRVLPAGVWIRCTEFQTRLANLVNCGMIFNYHRLWVPACRCALLPACQFSSFSELSLPMILPAPPLCPRASSSLCCSSSFFGTVCSSFCTNHSSVSSFFNYSINQIMNSLTFGQPIVRWVFPLTHTRTCKVAHQLVFGLLTWVVDREGTHPHTHTHANTHIHTHTHTHTHAYTYANLFVFLFLFFFVCLL